MHMQRGTRPLDTRHEAPAAPQAVQGMWQSPIMTPFQLTLCAMQMRGRFVVLNWILSERLTAVAAPLWQNIPIGNLTGYNVSLRVRHSCFLPA